MRLVKVAFLVLLAAALILLSLANRGPVEVRLLPENMAAFVPLPTGATLPLFLVIFAAILLGLLIGFVWEWLREHRYRAEALRQRRAAEELKREVRTLKGREKRDKDDVLALLE